MIFFLNLLLKIACRHSLNTGSKPKTMVEKHQKLLNRSVDQYSEFSFRKWWGRIDASLVPMPNFKTKIQKLQVCCRFRHFLRVWANTWFHFGECKHQMHLFTPSIGAYSKFEELETAFIRLSLRSKSSYLHMWASIRRGASYNPINLSNWLIIGSHHIPIDAISQTSPLMPNV